MSLYSFLAAAKHLSYAALLCAKCMFTYCRYKYISAKFITLQCQKIVFIVHFV
jgi:hypothetical protein